MRRRTFLKALFLPLVLGLPRPQQQAAATYTDSDGRTMQQLADLSDRNTQSGGVVYQP